MGGSPAWRFGGELVVIKHMRVIKRNITLRDFAGTGGWRKFQRHNVDLCNLHSSIKVTELFKRKRMRWTGYVARISEKEMSTTFKSENLNLANRHRWDCSIQIYLKERELEEVHNFK
jgi:hypothetical protein